MKNRKTLGVLFKTSRPLLSWLPYCKSWASLFLEICAAPIHDAKGNLYVSQCEWRKTRMPWQLFIGCRVITYSPSFSLIPTGHRYHPMHPTCRQGYRLETARELSANIQSLCANTSWWQWIIQGNPCWELWSHVSWSSRWGGKPFWVNTSFE